MNPDPCPSGECPTVGTPWPCPICSGVHRFPVPAWRKKLSDPSYRARILEIARQDHDAASGKQSNNRSFVDPWPLIHECDYRGPILRVRDGCQCEIRLCGLGKGSLPGKTHETTNGECMSCVKDWKRPEAKPMNPIRTIDENTFITSAQFTADTITFLATLPADIDCVVAIARSGLLPGSIVAHLRHLPMLTVSRQTGIHDPGHGGRMENRDKSRPPSHILLIDDTAASGHEMSMCTPIVRERFPEARITRAVIYSKPEVVGALDTCFATYSGLHYLEWNFVNAGHGQQAAFDMDGILNRDFTYEECQDDDTYRRVMADIEPLYLPRRMPVPLIVTARPESTRDITLEWLAKWGVKVDGLVMWPGAWHPPSSEVAPWKAKHYAESQYHLFIESSEDQSKLINEITGRPVLCPAARKLFPRRV